MAPLQWLRKYWARYPASAGLCQTPRNNTATSLTRYATGNQKGPRRALPNCQGPIVSTGPDCPIGSSRDDSCDSDERGWAPPLPLRVAVELCIPNGPIPVPDRPPCYADLIIGSAPKLVDPSSCSSSLFIIAINSLTLQAVFHLDSIPPFINALILFSLSIKNPPL